MMKQLKLNVMRLFCYEQLKDKKEKQRWSGMCCLWVSSNQPFWPTFHFTLFLFSYK